MKYILKQDLPTFKAGTEAWISEGGHLVTLVNGEMLIIYVGSTLAKFPNILTEWFEAIPEKQKAVPTGEELHYWIDECGGVHSTEQCHDDELSQWNWRWTREEAEAEVKKRAAIERVRRYLVRNDLLEEDKEEIYKTIYAYRSSVLMVGLHSIGPSYYSPYGRIKYTDLTQLLRDCREDLLLIHS